MNAWKQDLPTEGESTSSEETPTVSLHEDTHLSSSSSLLNDWVRDMEEIEREINQGK